MIKVGLTGGIGSGKTFVAKVFESLGIPVYNSDDRAKCLMNFNQDVRDKMLAAFGAEVYHNNQLNRKYLSDLIFNDKSKLTTINGIVHPAVAKDFKSWAEENKQAQYLIKEAAILVETGLYKELDYLIVVTAPQNIRIQRVKHRDNMTEEQVLQRINNQMPQKQKVELANFVINNDGIQLVDRQVQEIHTTLIKSK